ncbi:NAD(P)H-dependent oxidoreductase subunit E [Chloroflexota bacterium]
MAKIRSLDELETLRKSIISKRDPNKPSIFICGGTGCLALGAENVIVAFEEEIKKQGLNTKVNLKVTGCPGFCERGPLVVIEPGGILYQRVKAKDVAEIISRTIVKGTVVERLLYPDPGTGGKVSQESEIPFYKKQKRLLLGNVSRIDPGNIDDYFAVGGYAALGKALFGMSPEEIIGEVKKSGLRGRGGGGFPTGVKWESCRRAQGDTKYIICNCDEGRLPCPISTGYTGVLYCPPGSG